MAPSSNNCLNIGFLFIRKLGVRLTKNSFKAELLGHPDFPSILSLSESLGYFNIPNMVIGISIEKLQEIPFPGVGHFSKRGKGQFVIFERLEKKSLKYIDETGHHHTCEFDDLKDIWNGVVLLAEATSKSGEANYEEERRKEITKVWFYRIVLWAFAVVLVLPTTLMLNILIPFYLLKVVGSILCYFLLQKQFGGGNATIDSFCEMGSKSDCDSVINSPASKIFGVHLSEIGFWYFIGGLLSIVIGTLATESSLLGPLSVLSAVVLLFSLFAVYYQGWVIEKWCTLCLAVMGVFWLEFITHFIIGNPLAMTCNSLSIASVGFTLPLIFWLSVRQQFFDSFKLLRLERSLNRFLKSERVFQRLLEDQPEIEIGNFSNEFQAGIGEAPITIVVVSNPVCEPCAHAHYVVEGLLEQFEGKIKMVFRFAINPSDTKSVSYEMLCHLIALRLSSSNEKSIDALSSWYSKNGKNNIKKWKEENPISINQSQDAISSVMMEHAKWCAMAGISSTPTILIKGRILPSEFSVADLKYQIRKLFEMEVTEF